MATTNSSGNPDNRVNAAQAEWRVVNDTVMGGRSSSHVERNDAQQSVRFQGTLSLENNGGFASVRAPVNAGLFAGFPGVCLEVRGDGRTYQFRIRDSVAIDGVAFVTEFRTRNNEWQTIQKLFKDFEPRFRGQRIPVERQLQSDSIQQVGFLLADKRAGAFRLDIREIAPCLVAMPAG